jgi:ABC-2 type transport system ATP-binding protein
MVSCMRLHEVSFRYARRGDWVLLGVDAGIEAGEVVVVRGRNGAGKSTLLQLIAGVLRPTRGHIVDRPARIGWVPERFPAEQPFTVAGYLDAMAAFAGAGSPENWLERLGLVPFRTVRLGELSKGTAQKVGLAQALIARPDLLILDEPWEGLDAAARDLVPGIVAELTAAGAAVLVSDHRGETARLPGAVTWEVAAGHVTAEEPVAQAPWLIEVAADEGPAAVAALRAAGHQILRVRA